MTVYWTAKSSSWKETRWSFLIDCWFWLWRAFLVSRIAWDNASLDKSGTLSQLLLLLSGLILIYGNFLDFLVIGPKIWYTFYFEQSNLRLWKDDANTTIILTVIKVCIMPITSQLYLTLSSPSGFQRVNGNRPNTESPIINSLNY